jgi:hypothetical protein
MAPLGKQFRGGHFFLTCGLRLDWRVIAGLFNRRLEAAQPVQHGTSDPWRKT